MNKLFKRCFEFEFPLNFPLQCMCEGSRRSYIVSTLANVNIFGTRKDKACCPVIFRRCISISIFDLVLYVYCMKA